MFKKQLYNLDVTIRLNESFQLDNEPREYKLEELVARFEALKKLDVPVAKKLVLYQHLYADIFYVFPVIKIKIKPSVFESWAITHTGSELRSLLKPSV